MENDRRKEWLIWLFAATLFAQVLAYFGIDYFDQSKFVWYLILVMIGVATAAASTVGVSAESQQFECAGIGEYRWGMDPFRSIDGED